MEEKRSRRQTYKDLVEEVKEIEANVSIDVSSSEPEERITLPGRAAIQYQG